MKSFNPQYAGWAVGTLGASLLLNTFSVATLFFLVSVLRIDPLLAGTLIMVSKLYDAASDPVMGYISDRTRSRWGRRRPYLLPGGVFSGLAFALLFAAPASDGSAGHTLLIAACLILLSTAYTIFNVPYLAMPAEMSTDYHQRSEMMAYRVFLIAIGSFAGLSGAPALIGYMQGLGYAQAEAYSRMGALVGGLIAVCMVASFFGTRNARATSRTASSYSLREQAALVLTNRPFLLYLGIKLAGLFALAAITSTQFFFVVHVLERSVSTVALFGLAQFAGKLLSIPLWLKLARVRGKAWILALSTVLFIPLAGSWLLAGAAEPLWAYVARGFFLGIATAGTLLGAQAMLPDIMEYDYLRSGMRREGIYAGLASFIEKTAYALAAVAVGGFLAARGFDKSLPSGEQPETALFAISACIALIPMGAYGIKLLLLSFYRLDDRALRDARAAAVPRRATG